MTDAEREAVLAKRRLDRRPLHTPPTWDAGAGNYLITAACFEHRPHIGFNSSRMEAFAVELLDVLETVATLRSWVLLPNHYHALLAAANIKMLKKALAALHGRSAFAWNGEECQRGRKVWHAAAETIMKSDRHFWATVNYIHHNPVKHGYVARWQDWPWSSCHAFLDNVGRERAMQIWKAYPILDYGRDWDF